MTPEEVQENFADVIPVPAGTADAAGPRTVA